MFHKQICDQKAYFFILEGEWLLHKSKKCCSKGALVGPIRFVWLSICQEQYPDDLIISIMTSGYQGSLSFVVCFEVNIDFFISQEYSCNFCESYFKSLIPKKAV